VPIDQIIVMIWSPATVSYIILILFTVKGKFSFKGSQTRIRHPLDGWRCRLGPSLGNRWCYFWSWTCTGWSHGQWIIPRRMEKIIKCRNSSVCHWPKADSQKMIGVFVRATLPSWTRLAYIEEYKPKHTTLTHMAAGMDYRTLKNKLLNGVESDVDGMILTN
jgi:hypothetical protein